jgi:tetratricopeptide (TPR) repeat protein
MKRVIVDLAIVFLLLTSPAFAQFEKANEEFAAGNFKAAIADYENAVRNGEYSANLFYNLGNAYFRTQDFGHAILNYERALALDRHHAEAEANLRVARDAARALSLAPRASEKAFRIASVNQWTTVAAIAAWVFVFSVAVLTFSRRSRAAVMGLSILSLSILVIAVVAAYRINSADASRAIVVAKDVTARVATADNANRVLALPMGSEIEVVSKRGDWIYAALPNDQRGWIPASSAEVVRL